MFKTRHVPTVKLRHRIFSLMMFALAMIALSACALRVPVAAKTGEPFTLAIGQRASLADEDMLITFNEVIGDSRCPEGVNCIWAGVVSTRVTIFYQDKNYSLALNQGGGVEEATEKFFDFTLIYKIAPYPKANQTIAAKDYEMTMTISR